MDNKKLEEAAKETPFYKDNSHSSIIQRAIISGFIDGFKAAKSCEFAEWTERNYSFVISKKKSAWVNANENTIYTHGSEYHFDKLVNEHGKTINELYAEFLKLK